MEDNIFGIPRITNGSLIKIGGEKSGMTITVDKHFNRFQKFMMKICFGFIVEDYSEVW